MPSDSPGSEQPTTAISARAGPQPLVLPRISQTQLRLSQRLGAGLTMPLDDLGPPWGRMELMLASSTPWRVAATAPLRLIGRYGAIELADASLLSLVSAVQYSDATPEAERVALHRMALARIPPGLMDRLGGPFHILASDQGNAIEDSHPQCLLTLTEVNGDSHTFLLRASPTTLIQWSDYGAWRFHDIDWRSHPLRHGPLGRLSFTGGIHLGRLPMPCHRLSGLRPGDALLIPSKDGDASTPIHILLGSALIKFSQRDDDSYVFQGWVVEAPPLSNPSHVKAIEKVSSIMDALKVDLDFIVGRLSMTVAELAVTGIGRVLPLEVATPPVVRIVAHGTELGSGELIDVNGRMAVRIIEWGTRP